MNSSIFVLWVCYHECDNFITGPRFINIACQKVLRSITDHISIILKTMSTRHNEWLNMIDLGASLDSWRSASYSLYQYKMMQMLSKEKLYSGILPGAYTDLSPTEVSCQFYAVCLWFNSVLFDFWAHNIIFTSLDLKLLTNNFF